MMVPAVTEVCRPQPAHSYVKALVLRSQARPSPQPGQTNPCGQRRSKRYSAHSLSLAKRPWNSINDFGNRPSDPDIAFPRPSQTEGSYLHVPVLYTTFRRTGLSYI